MAFPLEKKTGIIFLLIIGAILLFLSPGFVLSIVLTLYLFHLAFQKTDSYDRKTVLTAACLAILIRIAAIALAQYFCYLRSTLDIFGDAANNFELGYKIESLLKGDLQQFKILKKTGWYNVHGLTFFNGVFFTFFGKHEIFTLKYLNSLSIVVAGWLLYDFTKKIFSSAAGKIAMIIFLFWPTVILWSITDLKESHLILSVVGAVWCAEEIRRKKELKPRLILLSVLLFLALYAISLRRFLAPLFGLIFFIAFAHYLLNLYRKRNEGKSQLFLIGLASLAVFFLFKENISRIAVGFYGKLIFFNQGYLNSGGWNYDLLSGSSNHYTVAFFLEYFIRSWYHFLLEPLPWNIRSLNMLVFSPVMFFWYLMLFLSIVGLKNTIRAGMISRLRPILIFLFLYTSIVGMSIANIGTAVRFRDLMLPFIAIFTAIGMTGINGPNSPESQIKKGETD